MRRVSSHCPVLRSSLHANSRNGRSNLWNVRSAVARTQHWLTNALLGNCAYVSKPPDHVQFALSAGEQQDVYVHWNMWYCCSLFRYGLDQTIAESTQNYIAASGDAIVFACFLH